MAFAFAAPLPHCPYGIHTPCSKCLPARVRCKSSPFRFQRSTIYATRTTTPNTTTPSTPRTSTIHRQTRETDVTVTLNLDGTGNHSNNTGIPFLDHMLTQVSSHGLLDLTTRAKGDTWIDDHHTNEDVGIAFGMALSDAIGDKRGITRFGHFTAPLDEALVEVVLDFSGRGFCSYGLVLNTEKVGRYDTELVKEFYEAVARNAGITLHVRMLHGGNSHHVIEASFKAFARALRMAVEFDPRRLDKIPSSKGALSDTTAVMGNGPPES